MKIRSNRGFPLLRLTDTAQSRLISNFPFSSNLALLTIGFTVSTPILTLVLVIVLVIRQSITEIP
ncbi:MAG: hypothetical protein WB053_12520, partial [Nitrososphaeraceae archaeon]